MTFQARCKNCLINYNTQFHIDFTLEKNSEIDTMKFAIAPLNLYYIHTIFILYNIYFQSPGSSRANPMLEGQEIWRCHSDMSIPVFCVSPTNITRDMCILMLTSLGICVSPAIWRSCYAYHPTFPHH